MEETKNNEHDYARNYGGLGFVSDDEEKQIPTVKIHRGEEYIPSGLPMLQGFLTS